MRNLFLLIIIGSMIFLTACNTMKRHVDIIVHNAVIYTVDSIFSIDEAMAINDGMFVETGNNEKILSEYDADIVIDGKGFPVYPGFIDAHCHYYSYGLGLLKRADLSGTGSFDEVLDIMQEHREKQPGEWLEGRGWDQNDWEVKEFPTKEMLDQLFPDIPVVLTRVDGHAALVNSEALKRAGITSETQIQGGKIIIKNGKPTGLLIDNAIDLIRDIIPETDRKKQVSVLLQVEKNCFSVGLTGIVDACSEKDIIELIDSLQQEGMLNLRINCMMDSTKENFETFFESGIYQTDRLKVNAVKLFADGALGSRGACLLEPYNDDPGNYGIMIYEPDYYRNICEKAYEKGFQVNTHAIGDSAIRMILEIYGEILKGKNDRRWRIEHAQVVAPEDFEKFGKYSVIPSVQATHATSDMYWAGERLGNERVKNAYAYKKLLDQNGWLPNGTDFPVEQINPVFTFYASVARKDLNGFPEGGFQIENALNRKETLRSMTIWAAKGSFDENERGSIEPGKYADFVILDRDMMTVPEEEIPRTRVLNTFLGGEEVYSLLNDE
jgi:predicted amidohydrolase YtcJ